jgi:hypothetical protein
MENRTSATRLFRSAFGVLCVLSMLAVLLFFFLAPVPALASALVAPGQPSALTAVYRSGQTFLTWQERSDLSGERYRIYRHSAPIDAGNLASATLLYEAPEGSALFFANRYYTYSTPPWAIRYSERLIIADLAAQLDPGIGLLVWTLAGADFSGGSAGNAYYAVTTVYDGVENSTDFSAANRVGPVAESIAAPQPVHIRAQPNGWQVYIQFMDLREWNPTFHAPGVQNSYYGLTSGDYGVPGAIQYAYDYALYVPDAARCGGALPATLPVFLSLHAWAGNGYGPFAGAVGPWCAYIIAPVDQGESWWFGFARSHDYRTGAAPGAGNVIVNYTEQRVLQMIDHLLRHPPGPPADPARVFVSGHSMGGGGTLALALRYPQVFAAANASKPVTDHRTLTGWTGNTAARWGAVALNLPVQIDAPNGWADHLQPFASVGVWDWQNLQAYLATRIISTTTPLNLDFATNDTGVSWITQGAPFFASAEVSRQNWGAWVGNNGHDWGAYAGLTPDFHLSASGIPFAGLQASRNESVPAFSQSSSDPPLPPTTTGAFHHSLFWSSSWLPWDGAPIDTPERWQVSVCAVAAGAGAPSCGGAITQTVSITPRRLQHFQIIPNTPYYWQSQSIANSAVVATGIVTADANGLVTVPSVTVTPTGNRILLLPAQTTGSATLALGDVDVAPGQQVTVVLSLSPTPLPVYSMDLRVGYDPTAVTLVGVQKGAAVADGGWISAFNLNTAGLVRAGLATGNQPLSDGGDVLLLTFQAIGPLQSSALTVLQGDLNEGSIPTSFVNGSITINSRPLAANDTYSVEEGNKLTVASAGGVLANDVEPDGQALIVVLVTAPQHGLLDLQADGSFVYTPTADFSGSDSFAYTASDSLGGSANASVSIVIRDVIHLSLPSTNVLPGASVVVPVQASEIDGVLNRAEITIGFNAAVVSFQGATVGDLTSGWSLVSSTPAVGKIHVLLDHGVALLAAEQASAAWGSAASGVLVNLQFQAIGAQGSSSALIAEGVLFNNGDAVAQTSNGLLTVETLYSISGSALFWRDSRPVQGVTITATGPAAPTTSTAANGAYVLPNLPAGSYGVTPTKADQANGITAYDAALALRHAVGLSSLSGHAAAAADVTSNGEISAADASLILRRSVDEAGLQYPGSGALWRFSPESRTYSNLTASQSGQDFTSVLMGDISGNWNVSQVVDASVSENGPHLLIEIGPVEADNSVAITIGLAGASVDVYGVDLAFNFAVDDWSVVDVTHTQATADWMLAWSAESDRLLHIGLANAEPLTGVFQLAVLRLRSSKPVTVNDMQPTLFSVNEQMQVYTPGFRQFLPFVLR